jgi:hypothetical protein
MTSTTKDGMEDVMFNIQNVDNKITTVKDRIDYVKKIAEENRLSKSEIESLGSYILDAKDIESNRKVDYRFWRTNKEFWKYKEAKNINETTAGGDDDAESTLDIIAYNEENVLYDEKKLMDFSKLDVNKQFLQTLHKESLETCIGEAIYEFRKVLDRIELTRTERAVVNALRLGYDVKELGKTLKMNQRTAYRTINYLAEKVAKQYKYETRSKINVNKSKISVTK